MTHPQLQALSPLTRVQLGLMAIGYEVAYIEPFEEEGVNFEQLMIRLHQDDEGNDYLLDVYFVNDLLDQARYQNKIPPYPDKAYTLQMSINFPFKVKEGQWGELACLALELNRLIDCGAYGVHQAEGFYFRYAHVEETKEINLEVLAVILDSITGHIKGTLVLLHQYFKGLRTLDEVYELINDTEQQVNKGKP